MLIGFIVVAVAVVALFPVLKTVAKTAFKVAITIVRWLFAIALPAIVYTFVGVRGGLGFTLLCIGSVLYYAMLIAWYVRRRSNRDGTDEDEDA